MTNRDELMKVIEIGNAVNYLHNLYLVEEYEYVKSSAKRGEKPVGAYGVNIPELVWFISTLNLVKEEYFLEVAALHLENVKKINDTIWEEYSMK